MTKFKVGDRVLYTYDGACNSVYEDRRRKKTKGTVAEVYAREFGTTRYDVLWDDGPGFGRIPENKLSLANEKENTMTRELIGKKPEPTPEPHVAFPVEASGTQVRDSNQNSVVEVRMHHLGTTLRRLIASEVANLLNEAFEGRNADKATEPEPKFRLRKFIRKSNPGLASAFEVTPGHVVLAASREDAIRQWETVGKDITFGRHLNEEFFRRFEEDEAAKDGAEYKLREAWDRDGDKWVERVPGRWHMVRDLERAEEEHARGVEGSPSHTFTYGPLTLENGSVIPEHL